MRPTGLSSPVDRELEDFTIFSGGWAIGRIYEQRGGPDHMRWFWALHGFHGKPVELHTDGHAPTLEQAKAQFSQTNRPSSSVPPPFNTSAAIPFSAGKSLIGSETRNEVARFELAWRQHLPKAAHLAPAMAGRA
jgi:hypothetical protein